MFTQDKLQYPGYSYIRIVNRGGYIADFSLYYIIGKKMYSQTSPRLELTQSAKLYIPYNAIDIYLKVKAAIFIDTWSEFYSKTFAKPVTECYQLTGTFVTPNCSRITCEGFNNTFLY